MVDGVRLEPILTEYAISTCEVAFVLRYLPNTKILADRVYGISVRQDFSVWISLGDC